MFLIEPTLKYGVSSSSCFCYSSYVHWTPTVLQLWEKKKSWKLAGQKVYNNIYNTIMKSFAWECSNLPNSYNIFIVSYKTCQSVLGWCNIYVLLCSYLKRIVKFCISGNWHPKWLFHHQNKVSLQSPRGRQKLLPMILATPIFICIYIYFISSIPPHGWMSSTRINQYEIDIKQRV